MAPTLRQRVYAAAAALGLARKKAPFAWPTLYDGVVSWQLGNFLDYVGDGFALNPLIYSAIMYKVRSAAQARLKAYTGDPENPESLPPDHPLSRLVARPNPYQSFPELHGQVISYLNLSGNAYLYIDREGAERGVPSGIYPLRPDRMFIIPKDGMIAGYQYRPYNYSATGGAVNIIAEDIIHIKFPNPGDLYEGQGYGLSPMSALAQSGNVDNQVTRFLKNLFDRGGLPLGLLKYDIPLEDDQITEIKRKWREIYGGVSNWGDIGILPEGASYSKLGMNFEEMGFKLVDERNESRILGPFGVPPILIGTRFGLMRSTYSNYEEARRAFWEDTMSYELTLQEDEYMYYLQSDDGGFVKWDLSRVPALRQDMPKLIESANKLFLMGTPANIAFSVVGLKVPMLPGGDISYLPQNLRAVDLDGEPAAVEDDNDGAATALTETRALSAPPPLTLLPPPPATKGRLTQGQVDEAAGEREPDFLARAAANFREDRDEILKLANQHKRLAIRQRKSIDWVTLGKSILEYLQSASTPMWRETFTPLIEGTCNDAGIAWSSQLGVVFDLRSLEAEAWFADYTLKFAQPIIQTTSDDLQLIIAQGMEEGWSIDTLSNNISSIFKVWSTGITDPDTLAWLSERGTAYRAEMIARTETIRAFNAGSQQHFSDWGYGKKEWLAANDKRTRHSHSAASGQVVDTDKPFKVGGYDMMYPGDASMGAPGSEFINCRCALLPVIGSRVAPS